MYNNHYIKSINQSIVTIETQGALPFLLTYAVALNVIPAARWLVNKRENAKIEERNFLRRKWAEAGRSGGAVVQRKLKAAKTMATGLK